MLLKDIRNSFLKFFAGNNHTIMPSSSLVPHNDPSLMFTNSGMVQFKNWFLGIERPKHLRVTTSQRCVRAGGKHNDLDNVGYTARHHTFFEMLGNFSFGDYFKDDAINFAWNFLTNELKINKEKLYITIYHTDDEAYSIWKKVANLDDSRIIKIATKDNFWSMGETGPCGPCSEIFYDHGDKYEGGLPGSDNEGDRYIEIWNLVFMQYEQQLGKDELIPLQKKAIDTGIGLERLTAVMQGVNDNFETDAFQKIISTSKKISGNNDNITAHKVIADHLRAMCFLIADGILPSNEGRGYVLRRIMRRAMRYIKNVGYKKPMLFQLVDVLIDEMGEQYHELIRAEKNIKSVLFYEEEKFGDTLEKGLKILNEEISKLGNNKKILSGKTAFKLYDTYGFPIDLTKDILRQAHLSVEENEFEKEMVEQKIRARQAWQGSGEQKDDLIWFDLAENLVETEFFGYTYTSLSAQVLAIISDGKVVQSLKKGDKGIVILNQTPFYAEKGGQIGDSGIFKNGDEVICNINDTKVFGKKLVGHFVMMTENNLNVGDAVDAIVDEIKRNKIRANHSATHLLHNVLREKLGEHVTQKGSLVSDEKLRFDFSYNQALTQEQISDIETKVNEMILRNSEVATDVVKYNIAIKKGAMALFGEKYDDEVRVVSMGNSVELCGGTHAIRTGDIGILKIITETSIASGVRRIEAITGEKAFKYCNEKCAVIQEISSLLKCSDTQITTKIIELIDEKKNLTKKLDDLKVQEFVNTVKIDEINGVFIATQECSDVESNTVMRIANAIINKFPKISKNVVIILSENDDKKMCFVKTNGIDAKVLGGEISKVVGGKGGGSSEMMQLGGMPSTTTLDAIINSVKSLL